MALDDMTASNSDPAAYLNREQNSSASPSDSVETLQLLEERLVVNRSRRKIGDVVVRKVIETQIVEVPVRREKIVVEQVDPNRTLAEIDLADGHSTAMSAQNFDYLFEQGADDRLISNNFLTIGDAVKFLTQLEQRPEQEYRQISVTLLLRSGAEAETAYFEFSHVAVAVQTLDAIASTLLDQCRGVQVDLIPEDA